MSAKQQFKNYLAQAGDQDAVNEVMAVVNNAPDDDQGFLETLDLLIPDYPPNVVEAWNTFIRNDFPERAA